MTLNKAFHLRSSILSTFPSKSPPRHLGSAIPKPLIQHPPPQLHPSPPHMPSLHWHLRLNPRHLTIGKPYHPSPQQQSPNPSFQHRPGRSWLNLSAGGFDGSYGLTPTGGMDHPFLRIHLADNVESRKFFTIVMSFNLTALALAIAGVWDYPRRYTGAMVLGNLYTAILIRNELFGRFLYLIVNTAFAKVR